MVPADVAKVIKEQRFLGYRPTAAEGDRMARERAARGVSH
jgi:hypothetical protein